MSHVKEVSLTQTAVGRGSALKELLILHMTSAVYISRAMF